MFLKWWQKFWSIPLVLTMTIIAIWIKTIANHTVTSVATNIIVAVVFTEMSIIGALIKIWCRKIFKRETVLWFFHTCTSVPIGCKVISIITGTVVATNCIIAVLITSSIVVVAFLSVYKVYLCDHHIRSYCDLPTQVSESPWAASS